MAEAMVERVARALAKAKGYVVPDDAWCMDVARYFEMAGKHPNYTSAHSLITDCFREARAAIEAMREPTDAMSKAANQSAENDLGIRWGIGAVECQTVYRAMIDAALQKKERG